jgi:hypothetical protein
MLLSSHFLKTSLENYNKSRDVEKFTYAGKSVKAGLSKSANIFILVIAFIFFIMELFLLYYAINIAIYCSTSQEERIVNFVLATIFTVPYVLVKTVFDPCAKNFLKNGFKSKI